MAFVETGQLRYYTFESFNQYGVTHGVFTRQGGVSLPPWASLNLGGTVGDEPERVQENRRKIFSTLGRLYESQYDVWQVHSADVVCTDAPRDPSVPHIRADVILTDRPEVTLFMRFADCVPVLLYDPAHHVVGLAHAGWLGTVRQVVKAAVEAMQARYGSRPEELLAGIGPSIAAHHYEVGPEVGEQVRQTFGAQAESLLPACNGAVQFDLWAANRLSLENCGVRQIEIAGLCTACHTEDWYSHRAEHGKTGRFGLLIGLSAQGGHNGNTGDQPGNHRKLSAGDGEDPVRLRASRARSRQRAHGRGHQDSPG